MVCKSCHPPPASVARSIQCGVWYALSSPFHSTTGRGTTPLSSANDLGVVATEEAGVGCGLVLLEYETSGI